MIDFRRLLPSKLKKALTDALFEKIKTSKLNHYADPTYRYADALRDHGDDVWNQEVLHDCFEAAKKRYETEHPKCWDNEKQHAYRDGFDKVRIVEHVSGVWSYHLALQGDYTALCGKGPMMDTSMPLSQWGVKSANKRLVYKWCSECREKADDS